MPYALVRANFDVPEEFDRKLSKFMSEQFKKHEGFLAVDLQVNKRSLRSGTTDKFVYCDLRVSDTMLTNEGDRTRWFKAFGDFFVQELGVEPLRCIVMFEPTTADCEAIEGKLVTQWTPPAEWYGL
ncbi:PREDICTED: uncharacterized protein LOC109462335 [Branchiostoma belcheri]|uniref:Uncharacterized protein LOC109462335 n=1 Tax=Branchiostoma belcheri TaxID=7741 RepID=A0A6P4XUY7_BRABE|nr:PREDICTED: uncharacterized protein LOC109462335 [Branchiostoma belcheri]